MKDKILEKTDELIAIIKESTEYQNYVAVSEKMQNNKEIMNLIAKVKQLQKELVKKESRNEDISDLNKEINNRISKLETFPIYLEYCYLQEDLNQSMMDMKEQLEQYINHITN